jgi:lysophospholipase L1-like esterase
VTPAPEGTGPKTARPRRRISPGRRALFVVVIVSVALLLLEGALRLTGRPRGLVRSFSGVWNHDPASLARTEGLFAPSTRKRISWPPELAYEAGFNAHGLRGPELAAARPPLRLLALGDSVTFGYYVEDADTWPARLEATLRAGGLPGVEVVNGGCGHFTITDEHRYLEERLLRLEPDVVVLQFCSNDVLDIELERSPTLYEELLHDADTSSGPGEWLRATALGELQLELALRLKGAHREPPTGMAPPAQTIPDAAWARYEAELVSLRDLVRRRGVDLVVLAFPDLSMVQDGGPSTYDAHLSAICARAGVPFRSALAEYRSAPDPHALYHWPYDPHPSALGNAALARTAQVLLGDAGLLRARR